MSRVFEACYQIRLDASKPKKPTKKCSGGYSIPSNHTCGGKKDEPAKKSPKKCGRGGCKISDQAEYRDSRLLANLPPAPHKITFSSSRTLGGVVAYRTEKGSTYVVGSNKGSPSSMRYKIPHEYHDPNDKGWKKPSDLTVYVNSQTATEIARWMGSSAEGRRIAVSPETGVVLLDDNPLTGEKRRNRLFSSNDFSMTPEKGLSPLEFWEESSLTQGGFYVFRGFHPGNEITEVERVEDLPSPKRGR